MTPASWPREHPELERLLRVDPKSQSMHDTRIESIAEELEPGDLLVVNDAATLPAALRGTIREKPIEVRLLARPNASGEAYVMLLGPGEHTTRTEDRPPPPAPSAGDVIRFSGLSASVLDVSHAGRGATLRFDRTGAELFTAIHRAGRPIQYAHVPRPLAIWHVTSSFASRPWAMEMPSAGRPLGFGVLADIRRRGVGIGVLTHAAGISSTGDAAFDAELPLGEEYDIPLPLVSAIEQTKNRGGRVVAVGTTVVRALEGNAAAHAGVLVAENAVTHLRIEPGFRPRIVDGILTGIHEPGTSHFDLISAFAPRTLLEAAIAHAANAGYLGHELGDSMLIL
jgi:S-adenosylmethionine:tRNA ribosyltransferase-isomerase